MVVLNDGGPLHVRVSRELRAEIEGGSCSPGQPLPSERDLAGRLNVSRATIRRALDELTDDGLVERSADGRCLLVRSEPLTVVGEETDNLMSFTELARSRGLVASADLLACESSHATFDEADLFAIAPGAALLRIERRRRLDGVAVVIEQNLVPLAYLPDADTIDWSHASLYDELERHGRVPVFADYSAESVGADERYGDLLDVEVGTPLLATTTVSRDERGSVLETGRQAYRGDRYRFRATLRRRTSFSQTHRQQRPDQPHPISPSTARGGHTTDLRSPAVPV